MPTQSNNSAPCGNVLQNTPKCSICRDPIVPAERALLKPFCLWCGEEVARSERKYWCVLTPHKQGPMFFTAESAREMARGINNKGGLVK